MSGVALVICVAGALVVVCAVFAVGRYPDQSTVALVVGSVMLWLSFWMAVLG